MLSEVPELVDFLFLADAPDDPDSWEKAIATDEGAARILADALAAYEALSTWDKDSLHEVTLAIAEAVGRKLGKAQAPIRVAVMGRTRGLPLFDSLAVLGRSETCRRLAAALGRVPALPPDALRTAPLGAAHCDPRRDGDRPLLRRHPGAGVADLAPVRPAPGGRHPGHGGGAVRLHPHARPAGPARPGSDPLPPGYAKLIMVTGSKEPGDKCTEAESGATYLEQHKGVPKTAILEAGGNDSYREHRRRRTGPDRPRRQGSWSPPTPSMRTAPWPSAGPGAVPVADADPVLTHHGLVDGALFLEGGARRRTWADHRLQPPGVAA